MDALVRSTGMEPSVLEQRVKWHLVARMIPFVETVTNVCELGPRGTGKSHIYKEISPNSILVSGGTDYRRNLFYNLSNRQVGLVGLWDVVAFDEVAGISFKDKGWSPDNEGLHGIRILCARQGPDIANASMVFVGNINQPVDTW